MSSSIAPRCRYIKINGTQCGSPALRDQNFCFYHQQNRMRYIECYAEGPYATGEIVLPVFEDAHSVQSVIRQVVQMLLQKRIERKTASTLLYALQIASSNLKRMDLEKADPEQVVVDLELEANSKTPMATRDNQTETDLPPGTIQACYEPSPTPARVARAPRPRGRDHYSNRRATVMLYRLPSRGKASPEQGRGWGQGQEQRQGAK